MAERYGELPQFQTDVATFCRAVVEIAAGTLERFARLKLERGLIDFADMEREAAENMKRTWLNYGKAYDFTSQTQFGARTMMERGSEVKNIWVPYGDANEGGKSY